MLDDQNTGEIVIFNGEDGEIKVQIDAVNETIWLSQKGMAELFGVSVPAINQHVKNIYEQEELKEDATIKKNLIVRQEGTRHVSREVVMYNLDVIIAVGYRDIDPAMPARKSVEEIARFY